MAPFTLRYGEEAGDDLDGVPANLRRRIVRAMEGRLTSAPDRYGERLAQSLAGLWRIRSGDYRIVYEIDEASRTVTIWAIRHRREVYAEVLRRWLAR